MERKFNITMRVPLGNRCGTLCFTQQNSKITGTINVLGNENPFTGTIDNNGFLEFTGKLRSLFHSFSYIAKGYIINSVIKLEVTGERYSLYITGEEISQQEEKL